MWFTETALPPIILMSVISIGLLISFFNTKRGVLLIGSLLLWAASAGVYFVEQAIVTESEKVEQAVLDVATAFQQQEKQKTLSFFSDFASDERAFIESQFDKIEVQKDLRITAMQVTMENEKTAIADFRANGSVVVVGYGNSGRFPTRWKIRMLKEEAGWKIVKVTRLHPINGKEIGYMYKEN
ncbi:hypothetical protein MNBD_PLANCTO02-3434 [hydrothermal vent metagenome]|uniref:Uncharacterized protein n=1 Tax=hydrothermal vent metagenome TaxID=652676 RepID=A0A3B1D6B9_9ZZZZ